jgi:lipoyl-dependent peroxiredoxin
MPQLGIDLGNRPTKEDRLMATSRRATATWSGDLLSGNGTVTAATTGTFKDQPTTWASRIGETSGTISPEELLASAHASCFSMAFSNILAKAGTPPTRVDVEVTISADKLEAGFTVQSAAIVVRGVVPGATQESFAEAAGQAKDGCPISRALKGNVAMTVEATLEG